MKINENPEFRSVFAPKYTGKLDRFNPNEEMIFELIRYIKDPEHPNSLEELNVVDLSKIEIFNKKTKYGRTIQCIKVLFTPTVPHCSMASIIGLSIIKVLSFFFKKQFIRVEITEDGHSDWKGINKQLDDKDRVLAAFENQAICDLIDQCVSF